MIQLPHLRRLARYRLRTLLLVVTVLCVWLGWNLNRVHQREQLIGTVAFLRYAEIPSRPLEKPTLAAWMSKRASPSAKYLEDAAPLRPDKSIPWAWRMFGAEPLDMDIRLPRDEFTDRDVHHYRVIFPECSVCLVDPGWRDRRGQ